MSARREGEAKLGGIGEFVVFGLYDHQLSSLKPHL
jgi:hypothetical protein